MHDEAETRGNRYILMLYLVMIADDWYKSGSHVSVGRQCCLSPKESSQELPHCQSACIEAGLACDLQALCINKDVLKLRQPSRINEKCLDLQKPVKDAAKVIKDPKSHAYSRVLRLKIDC